MNMTSQRPNAIPDSSRGGPTVSERARQHVNAQPGPPEMANTEPLHVAIVKGGVEKEQQQVGWIEKSGLNVADEGRAAIEMRIPERKPALAQSVRGEAVCGKEKTDEIAAVGRLVDRAADRAPEECQKDPCQQSGAQQVPASSVASNRQPGGCPAP